MAVPIMQMDDVSGKALQEPMNRFLFNDDTIKNYLINAISIFRNSPKSSSNPTSRSSTEKQQQQPRPERCFCGKFPFSDQDCVLIKGKPFYLMQVLDSGASAKVYHATQPNVMCVAVKKVPLAEAEEEAMEVLKSEVSILQRLDHSPYIVDYYGSITDKNDVLWIAMEPGVEDLHNRLQYSFGLLKTSLVMHYWTQMLRCVDAIHKKGVIHLDLKPENFVFFTVRGGKEAGGKEVAGKESITKEMLKLIDFGYSATLEADGCVSKECCFGTVEHMSPEHVVPWSISEENDRTYKLSTKTDIWSLGTILYLMLYGKTPFERYGKGMADHRQEVTAVMQAIANGDKVRYSDRKDAYLNHVVKRCLVVDPRKRPTAAQLLLEATDSSARPYYASKIYPETRKEASSKKMREMETSMADLDVSPAYLDDYVSGKKMVKPKDSALCSIQAIKCEMEHLPQLGLIH